MAKILTLLVLLMTAVTGAWATDYYVVGTMTGWQKNDQYKMTLNASAATTEYQLGIALAATDEFKVIGVDGDNPWVWYPDGNDNNYGQNGELTADGLYTIYFRPNGDGGSDWFYNYIYVAEDAYLAETSGEWTLTQPAFDVELEVEYFPLATLATTPAAADGLIEGTVADLLTAGTSAEGTLNYAVSQSDTEAPASGWSETIPTTEGLDPGTYYVWYKVVGDAEHSDIQPQSIEVTIAALPTFAITIDDGNKDAGNWQADPTEQKAGQKVTLTYGGKKKIRSITIEKAATTPAAAIAPALMDGATVVIECNCDGFVTYFTFTNNGGTYSCNITGDESDYFSASLTKQGNTLVFVAQHSDMPDSFDNTINFDTTSDTYSFAKKAQDFFYFKISVNGTDITDKLSEVQ